MRKAFSNLDWLVLDPKERTQDNPDGVYGLCLGFDHCAEHEWGIRELSQLLGIDTTQPARGIGSRQVTVVPGPAHMAFVAHTKTRSRRGRKQTFSLATLWVSESATFGSAQELEAHIKKAPDSGMPRVVEAMDLWEEHAESLATAWDSRGFCITVEGAENIERLEALHTAMLQKDLCVSLAGRSNPFAGSGLCLTIASRIPESVRQSVLAADLDHIALQQAALDTGIEQELNQAGKQYFALAPRWADKGKTSVVFWLNPQEQSRNNSGWFSVQQLRDWIANKGPIPKHGT